jgi:hypothetical protein
VGSCGGDGRCQLRYALLRRGGNSVGNVSESASYSRCKRRWRRSRLGKRTVTTWGSPRQPLMTPAERLEQGRQARASSPCGAPFIAASCPLYDAKESEGRENDRTCTTRRAATGGRARRGPAHGRARGATRGGRGLPRCSGCVRPGNTRWSREGVRGDAGRRYGAHGAARVRPSLRLA